jgi:ATP-dependent Clp protease ATP-binding subunit ClpA
MPPTRTEALDQKIIASLSHRANAVMALSQVYSRRLGVIHMEHLLFALVDVNTAGMLQLMKQAAIDRSRLLSELAKFNVPVKPLEAATFKSPVNMSAHVAQAIGQAESFRRSRRGDSLRTRDTVLLGSKLLPSILACHHRWHAI